MKISIVVPVYGCPEAIKQLHIGITEAVNKITDDYEIIFVNDACPKNSWAEIKKACEKDSKTIGINLSRNFGQIHSTNAGIDYSSGDYVVVMDCDLQDNPSGISILYKTVEKGYDIVFVKRKNRKDSIFVKLLSGLFYKIYNHFVDGSFDKDVANYCIVKKKVIDEYKKIKDNNKSFTTTICWMGYKATYISLEANDRFAGKSSYNFSKKINLAIDMLTSQSNKPLKAIINLGLAIVGLSFVYLIIQLIIYFTTNVHIEGWMSVFTAIFLMGGIIIVGLGCVGIYIGNIFNQTKCMPEYIIDEILNEKK